LQGIKFENGEDLDAVCKFFPNLHFLK